MTHRPALWTEAFLAALRRTDANVVISADLAGITSRAVYKRRKRDPVFVAAMDAVIRELAEARTRRAVSRRIA